MKFIGKSQRVLRKIFRLLLVGMLAFIFPACGDCDCGNNCGCGRDCYCNALVMYGMPAVTENTPFDSQID